MSNVGELIGTIALEKVLWAIDFVKIGYWALKAQKIVTILSEI